MSSVTDDAEGLAALGVRSALRVPLLVRGKPTGVLSLLITDDSRRFVADDLPTIEALADRAALALENARLYELAVSAKRARDEMMSMVSHDLRNSLNAIGFIATELARQNGSPLATQIRSAATLADRLLADLGAMFVIESGALVLGRVMESIDSIMSEVADLFRPLAEARAVRLRAVSEKQGLTAFVDRYRMVQAVSNVVANAVEISEDGGQVDLAVKQVGDHVEVAISDTGPGIAPEEVEQIFDRNRWGNDGRRRASVGLGLVISKEYVEAHGGRIRVQNRPGSGSTFIIAIPMQPRGIPTEMPPPKRRAPSPTRPARATRRRMRGPGANAGYLLGHVRRALRRELGRRVAVTSPRSSRWRSSVRAVGRGDGAAEEDDLRYDWRVDGAVTAAAFAFWGGTQLFESRLAPADCRWCNPGSLDASVRGALRWNDTSAANLASNLGAYVFVPLASLGLLALDAHGEGRFGEMPGNGLVIAESVALAGASPRS